MSILYVVLVLAIIGVALWALNTFIPMEGRIKQLINVLVIIVAVVWVLKVMGVWAMIAGAKI